MKDKGFEKVHHIIIRQSAYKTMTKMAHLKKQTDTIYN